MDIQNLHRDGRWHAPFLPCWKPADGPHPRKRPRVLSISTLAALAALLMMACTAVEDPSARWKTSGMDAGLEGKWVEVKEKGESGKEDVFAKQKGDYYTFFEGEMAVRTFTVGHKHFMVMVSPEAAKDGFDKAPADKRTGVVWMYEIKDDALHLRMLDDAVLDKAITDGRIKGNVQKSKADPSIATLDDATCAALAELAKEDKAWKEVSHFKRAKGADAPPARQTDK